MIRASALLAWLWLGMAAWAATPAGVVRTIRTVDTVDQLVQINPRSLSEGGVALVYVTGLHQPREYPARLLIYDRGAVDATDDYRVYAPTNGEGRWIASDSSNVVINVRSAGAVPDNTTSVNGAVEDIYTWLKVLGGGTIQFPAGTWRVGAQLQFTNAVDLGVEIQAGGVLNGTELGENEAVLRGDGELVANTTLSVPVPRGAVFISVVDGSEFAPGDRILLTSTNLWAPFRYYYNKGEMNDVRSVSGNVITLVSATRDFYGPDTVMHIVRPVTLRVFGGGRIAAPTTGTGVRIVYGDNCSISDITVTGSERSLIAVGGVRDSVIEGCFLYNYTGEAAGFGYGILGGYCQGLRILNNHWIATPRHGIVFGSSGYALPIVNRYIQITGNVLGAYGTNAASLDLHANCEFVTISENWAYRGVSLGGNHHKVIKNFLGNPDGQPAIGATEATGTDYLLDDNDIFITDVSPSQTVFGMRFYIPRASGDGVSTNGWMGSGGLDLEDVFQYSNNRLILNTPGSLAADTYINFFDGQDNLPDFIDLGHFKYFNNNISGSGATNLSTKPYALYLHSHPQFRWKSVELKDNKFGKFPVTITAAAASIRVRDNSFLGTASDLVPALDIRGTTNIVVSDLSLSGNRFEGLPNQAIRLWNFTGKVVNYDNTYHDYAKKGTNGAITVFVDAVGTTNLLEISSMLNRYSSTNTGASAISGSSAGTHLIRQSERLPAGMSYDVGTFASSIGIQTDGGRLKFVGGVTSFQGYTTGTFPDGELGDVALDTSQGTLVMRTVRGMEPFRMVSTNAAHFADVVLNSLSIGPGFPASKTAMAGTYPIYSSATVNDYSRFVVHNSHTGTAVAAGYEGRAPGVTAGKFASSTNASSAEFKARWLDVSYTGAGHAYDITYPGSMNFVWTYGGGNPFVRLDTNVFRLLTPVLQADAGIRLSGTTRTNWPSVITDITGLQAALDNRQLTNPHLTSISGLPTNGLLTKTASGTVVTRHLAGDSEAVVTNGDGVSGNPTVSIGSGIARDAEIGGLLDPDLQEIAGATGASNLVGEVDFAGHFHSADRARANHTGTQAISTVVNLQAELDNRQLTNPHLTSISGLPTNGLFAKTASGTVVTRHLAGDSEAVVTNGDGVSGNPTVSIGSGIARDSEIATLLDPDLQEIAGASGASNLIKGVDFAGHFHSADRARANHTGTQLLSTISDAGTAAPRNVPSSGNAASGEVVLGSDTRLADARTPTAHGHPAVDISDSSAAGRSLLTAADAAAQRSALGLGTAAPKNVPASGNAASGEVVLGSDTRLTDARTPTAHGHPAVDISDSSAAGRSILTAADAAAQRSALGLGTIAVINDAPSDGSEYVRKNGAWVEGTGGGGGGSTTRVVSPIFAVNTEVTVDAATLSETSVIGSLAFGSVTLGANSIATDVVYHLEASGTFSAAGNWSGGVMRVKLGGKVLTFTFHDPDSGTPTSLAWRVVADFAVSALGASSTVSAAGSLSYHMGGGTYTAGIITVGVSSGTLDTTVSNDFAVTFDNDPDQVISLVCNSAFAQEIGREITPGGGGVASATLASQRATEAEPPASNYATFSTRNSIGVMLYDSTVQESLRFRWLMPEASTATTVTVVLKWTTTATSGDARWGARNMSLTGDIDSDSFTTAVEATTTTSGTSGTVMTTTLSSAGLDGAAAGDWVWTEVYRDVSDAADTISADLELHAIEVRAE